MVVLLRLTQGMYDLVCCSFGRSMGCCNCTQLRVMCCSPAPARPPVLACAQAEGWFGKHGVLDAAGPANDTSVSTVMLGPMLGLL